MYRPPHQSETKVLIVDDQPCIRDALRTAIEAAPDLSVCAAVSTAEDAFRVTSEMAVDVVVMEVVLPDAHGLDVAANLLAQHDQVRVVFFSGYDENVFAERAIRSGALGYVMKREPATVVVEAIRHASNDQVYLSRGIASRIVTKAALRRGTTSSSPTDVLTDREVEVVQLLGQGISVADMSERLNLSRKTIETHRRHAKEKLGLNTISELITFAVRWTDAQIHMRPPRPRWQSSLFPAVAASTLLAGLVLPGI